MKYNILLADDDAGIRFVLSKYLTRAGYGVKATDNPQTLLKWAKAGEGDLILTDVHMGAEEIFKFVPELKTVRPDLPIIVISANTRMVTALKSRQAGVFEYIPKPFDLPGLQKTIERALDNQAVPQIAKTPAPDQMIGKSKVMQPVFRAISDYASGNIPVFIWGDVGAGKSLTAQCVHDAGARSDFNFLRFDGDMHKSEILDKVKKGDLFVDRLHELSNEGQAVLLTVLEQNELRSIGEKFRVIVTSDEAFKTLQTHNDMRGNIRADLLSHLMGGQIYVPPLCERAEDIAELALYFFEQVRPTGQKTIHKAGLARLKAHKWPGNVRELRSLMQVLALQFSDQSIGAEIVDQMLRTGEPTKAQEAHIINIEAACTELLRQAYLGEGDTIKPETSPYEQALEWLEKPMFAEALRLTGGNNSKAADLLGIHRNTLRTKLRKFTD
ncbi:MAG: sigma-54-dependent Fis family transcriptional regulator [Robiginitomaculum sp.]|nr:sigma-54-dependent Fis family transcriptional regulator [Robiginitomaculum sp.]